MNPGRQGVEAAPAPSARSEWQEKFEQWRRLITACQRKPSRRNVHALRVTTLRLQTSVEHGLEAQCDGRPQRKAAKRWTRQAEKLRRVLSRTRETDVHLSKLSELRGSLVAEGEGYQPRSSRLALRQIDALERTLRKQRKEFAGGTAEELRSRGARFALAGEEVRDAFSSCLPLAQEPGAARVRKMLDAVVEEFPRLDAECLHDFRKRIKKIRYQAEHAAETDPEAKKIAADLKAMQDTTGAWHDWEALGKIAARKFRARSARSGLRELLDQLTEEALREALDRCTAEIGAFALGTILDQEALDALVRSAPVPKPGVRRAEMPRELEQSLLA